MFDESLSEFVGLQQNQIVEQQEEDATPPSNIKKKEDSRSNTEEADSKRRWMKELGTLPTRTNPE